MMKIRICMSIIIVIASVETVDNLCTTLRLSE